MITAPHRSTWNALLACALHGDGEGLAVLAMARSSELRAARPMPRSGQPYGRRVLHATPEGEVMLASWRRGAACAPHDHGDARGIVVVLEARLTAAPKTAKAKADRAAKAAATRKIRSSTKQVSGTMEVPVTAATTVTQVMPASATTSGATAASTAPATPASPPKPGS